MSTPLPISVSHPVGVDYVLTVTNAADMTGWGLRFRIYHPDTNAVLVERTTGEGNVVIAAGGLSAAVTAGTISSAEPGSEAADAEADAAGSSGLTAGRSYYADVRRTDAGAGDESWLGAWHVTWAPPA